MSSIDREKWEQAAQELQHQRAAEKATWSEIDNASLARYVSGTATAAEQFYIEAALDTHPHLRDLIQIIQETLVENPTTTSTSGINGPEPNAADAGQVDKATMSMQSDTGQGTFTPIVWPVFASTPPPMTGKTDPCSKPTANTVPILALLLLGGAFLLGALACVGMMVVSGGESPAMKKAREDFAKAQQELEAWKKDAQQKEALMAQQKMYELKEKQLWDQFLEEQRIQRQKWDYQREQDLKNAQNDKILSAKIEEDRRRKVEEADRVIKERLAEKERVDADTKAKLISLQNQLDAANQKAQQATTTISQPPPPYYPYSWRNWGW